MPEDDLMEELLSPFDAVGELIFGSMKKPRADKGTRDVIPATEDDEDDGGTIGEPGNGKLETYRVSGSEKKGKKAVPKGRAGKDSSAGAGESDVEPEEKPDEK